MVAENSQVSFWYQAYSVRISSISSLKPMFNISSASSSTRQLNLTQIYNFASYHVTQAARSRYDDMGTPLRIAFESAPLISAPPYTATVFRLLGVMAAKLLKFIGNLQAQAHG